MAPRRVKETETIVVVGAREHNLQNVSLKLPRDTLTVFTGVSGSGKSSLAYDTLFKEGQRRFMESLSPYARQFLGQMEKPRVEHVEGLSPTVSIDQKTVNRNPRSTVGTITELYDHYRLLMARLGQPHCPKCRTFISTLTPDQIAGRIGHIWAAEGPEGPGGPAGKTTACLVLAPMVRMRKGEYRAELARWREQGFVRARIDGEVRRLDEEITLARYEKHSIELVLDRLDITPRNRPRLVEAVEKALELSGGLVMALPAGAGGEQGQLFNSAMACATCGIHIPELEPRLFSFNDPQGACPTCQGLGTLRAFTEHRLAHPELSLDGGALKCFTGRDNLLFTDISREFLGRLARELGLDPSVPWEALPPGQRRLFLEGNGGPAPRVRSVFRDPGLLLREVRASGKWPGLYRILEFIAGFVGSALERFQESSECPDCQGGRLNPVALAVRFREHNIRSLSALPIEEAHGFFQRLEPDPTELLIGKDIFREIRSRLGFLKDVGVGYLTLDRKANTLSGGEAQRIRLAAQVGSGLQGVLYVLDEPSIGLHQVDNRRLINTLQHLRDAGNTVYVVEHDQETIEAADHLVDLGPGAGSEGGQVLAQGSMADLKGNPLSLSGQYLAGLRSIPVPGARRPAGKAVLGIQGARRNNLDRINVRLPLGLFVAVTGVSGSGKSTLVHDIIKPALTRHLEESRPGRDAAGRQKPAVGQKPAGSQKAVGTIRGHGDDGFTRITGLQHLDKVIEIDQSPIGRTPRSNPATYTKALDHIRALFTQVPEARIRGYKPGRFSFNVKGGRCEACQGAGVVTIEMQFLSNVEVVCEECQGRRFNEETLQVHYKGRSIRDVLEMSVNEAAEFFAQQPAVARILNTLQSVGLGYIRLGQSSTTLSGGEAQRVKLASELRKRGTGRTLYMLDEPTTGLHFEDIRTLLDCLNTLVEQGNTVLVIEHNLDVIKVADHVIDLGPGGGKYGGRVVGQGTPEELAALPGSLTGQVLAGMLGHTAPEREDNGGAPRRRKARPARQDLFVKGAEQNNLRNIDVSIPRNRLTVITGVSGSGKTSLAFDTLFAEGQARYVESLSTYARRFLGRMDKARVEKIEGLSPAIAIDQKNSGRSPRSTVATVTEIYDYLRLLYARIGRPHCPGCGRELSGHNPTRLARELCQEHSGERLVLLAPLYRPGSKRPAMLDNPAHLGELAGALAAEGFTRLQVDGEVVELEAILAGHGRADGTAGRKNAGKSAGKSGGNKSAKIPAGAGVDLVLDRIKLAPGSRKRLAEALETGFEKGHGLVRLSFPDSGATRLVSEPVGCVDCDYYQDEPPLPRMFSFNSHAGACPACSGLGRSPQVDPELLVPFPEYPLLKGALVPGRLGQSLARTRSLPLALVKAWAKREGIDLERPFGKLDERERELLIYGDGQPLKANKRRAFNRGTRVVNTVWRGLAGLVMDWYQGEDREKWYPHVEPVLADVPCRECGGERLKPAYRAFTINGQSISGYCANTVEQALAALDDWKLDRTGRAVAEQPLQEIRSRLGFLRDVGLGYLTLDREASTLSGGEAQRIRLASQLGSHLVGVLYVLDEPTIGLHPRDTAQLLGTLKRLRDLGNTVVVVEHDPDTIQAADHVLDIGPGAGHLGGEVVAQGRPRQIMANRNSLTGAYLSGRLQVAPGDGKAGGKAAGKDAGQHNGGPALLVKGANANNLKNIDAAFPLGRFTCVTGVSGSGKSSLVVSVLQRALERRFNQTRVVPGRHQGLEGTEGIDKLVVIDQSPIGRTPKSNPATYTGIMDRIRRLMASTTEAKTRGYGPGRFSFNVHGGRCEACEGRGFNHIEMHFLADVWVPCDVCGSKRYNRETLAVRFRGCHIAEILDMEADRALELFANQPGIRRGLQTLCDVGLGYMKLGQPGNTLSGGEAQRVKLASELGRPSSGKTLYILDEPTTGLHMDDTAKLLKVLHRLVDEGNTVVVIEHNLDVIRTAHYLIDLGPEGGDAGGFIVATGTPAELARRSNTHSDTHTGLALAPFFRQ